MKNAWKWLAVVALAGAFLVGCNNEGPAERAGKKIDNAASEAGHQIEKAGDKIQDKANQ